MDEQLIGGFCRRLEKSGDKGNGEEELARESRREGIPNSGTGSTPEASKQATLTWAKIPPRLRRAPPPNRLKHPQPSRRRCTGGVPAPPTMRRRSARFRTPRCAPEAGCSAAAGCHVREPVDLKLAPRACCTRLRASPPYLHRHRVTLRNISRAIHTVHS